jgi:hypothetical protein
MKLLNELKATYKSDSITDLVDAANAIPLQLPETQEYHIEMKNDVMHIYGIASGIDDYFLGELGQGMILHGITKTRSGVQVDLHYRGIEGIILHALPYATLTQRQPPSANKRGRSRYTGSRRTRSSESGSGASGESERTGSIGSGYRPASKSSESKKGES